MMKEDGTILPFMQVLQLGLWQGKNSFSDVIEAISWNKIMKEAELQSMESLVLHSLELVPTECTSNHPINADCIAKLKNRAMQRLQSSLRVLYMQGEVVRLFEQEKIPYVILKGTSTACYYPIPELRALGDVDILLSPENMDLAQNILKKAGFSNKEDNHDIHTSFFKNGVEIELHHKVSRFPNSTIDSYVETLFLEELNHAIEKDCMGQHFYALRPLLTGLILLLHAQKHFLGQALGLRQLCDFAVFAASNDMQECQSDFIAICKKIGLYRFLQVVSKVAVLYFGVPQDNVLFCESVSEELSRQLLWNAFENGNFGHKREEPQFLFTGDVQEGSGRKLRRYFTAIMNGAVDTMPLMQKIPPLRLFAPIALLTRYLYRVAHGKRRMFHVKEQLHLNREKKALLRELQLFEQ